MVVPPAVVLPVVVQPMVVPPVVLLTVVAPAVIADMAPPGSIQVAALWLALSCVARGVRVPYYNHRNHHRRWLQSVHQIMHCTGL